MKTANRNSTKTLQKNAFLSKNPLISSLEKTSSFTHTTNGALTHSSTGNGVLDFFGNGGALRSRSESDIQNIFIKAISDNPLLAMKCLFHIRNCRGGAGERNTFRVVLRYLANTRPDLVRKNLENIVHFGRFDDIFELVGTDLENDVFEFARNTLARDFEALERKERISLAAKWTPSANASKKKRISVARKFCKFLKVSEKEYRQALSALRASLELVEGKMSAREWGSIDYSKIPSKASLQYRKAFFVRDESRYKSFLSKVEKGEAKINASTLFPYEIVEKVLLQGDRTKTVDVLWNAQKDYLEGVDRNILVVADVSGSMTTMKSRPLSTSIGLAIYTAERNTGDFKDYFLTFSDTPTLQKVVDGSIYEKIINLNQAHWKMNTNLQATFQVVLDHALANRVPAEKMPSQIIIISDMEFDVAARGTNLDEIKAKYQRARYPFPQLVFWNVNSVKDNVAARANDKGVVLVSGSSPSVFKTLLSGKNVTPLDQMLETLNDPMYDRVLV